MRLSKKPGFTLPEIILSIIAVGIISTITVNIIDSEIQRKEMEASKVVFNNEIAVAVADMQANGELAKLKEQSIFNKNIAKYFDFELIDTIDKIDEETKARAFAEKYVDENGKEFSYNEYKNIAISSKGISVAFTYDKNCSPRNQYSQDASTSVNNFDYIAKNEALSCIKGFYDVNGAKGPNKIGEDVRFFTPFTKDCEGNFIPDAYGKCPEENKSNSIIPQRAYCGLTELNCMANGQYKILDEKSCSCVCRLSCPTPYKLDEQSCTCGCNAEETEANLKKIGCTENKNGGFTKEKGYHGNCVATKQTCSIMCDANAKEQCINGGGNWDADRCFCNCSAKETKIDKDYYGFAKINWEKYCTIECKSESEVRAKANTNAQKAGATGVALTAANKALGRTNNINEKEPESTAKCFSCAKSVTVSDNGKNVTRNTVKNYEKGYCQASCPNAKDIYYTYNSGKDKKILFKYDSTNTCQYTCYKGTDGKGKDSGLAQLIANKFSNDEKYTLPRIDGEPPEIQKDYASASAIGKFKDPNKAYADPNHDTDGGNYFDYGRRYYAYYVQRCTECDSIYNALKAGGGAHDFAQFFFNSNQRYYYYNKPFKKAMISNMPNHVYAKKYISVDNSQSIKLSYAPNYNTCSVDLAKEFPYDSIMKNISKDIHYHGANVSPIYPYKDSARRLEQSLYTYSKLINNATSLGNNSLVIPNPNDEIRNLLNDATYKNYFQLAGYTWSMPTGWDKKVVGIKFNFERSYDPVALNIGSDVTKNPEADRTVLFKLVQNGSGYDAREVIWPKENYLFIVNKETDKSSKQDVGNMFSDVQGASNGFEQLKDEKDKDNDGLVSRSLEYKEKGETKYTNNELNDLWLWKESDNSYIPLTDIVFDINTEKYQATGCEDANLKCNIQAYYRKLIPIENKPEADPRNLIFVKADSKTKTRKERWKAADGSARYEWTPTKGHRYAVGTKPDDYNNWEKLNKATGTYGKMDPSEFPIQFNFYYKENGKWYQVVVSKGADIVFKLEG